MRTRVIAPGLSAPGLATRTHGLFPLHPPRQIVVRLTPERAYGAQGVVAARSLDARLKEHAHPRLRSTSVHSRLHACAPHAVGLCGLLHAPGSAAIANAPRSSELSPGHALGPSFVSPASHSLGRLGNASRKRQELDDVRTNRIPHHVSKTIATHPLPARDEADDIYPRMKVKNNFRAREIM